MQNINPFFSVIVPTYNRPETLVVALKSILKQSSTNYEVIIVNDGSTVDYSEIESWVQQYSFIKYIKQKNTYLAGARNTGIKSAKGQYICFLDDDDIYYNNHLEVLNSAIKNNNFKEALYHTRCILNKKGCIEKQAYSYKEDDLISCLLDDRFPVHSVCLPTNIAQEELFDTNLRYLEDLDLWLRVTKLIPIVKIDEYTVEYIIQEHSMVSWKVDSLLDKLNAFDHFKKNYKHILPASFISRNLAYINIGIADLYFQKSAKLKAQKHLLKSLLYRPKFLIEPYFYAVLRGLIK